MRDYKNTCTAVNLSMVTNRLPVFHTRRDISIRVVLSLTSGCVNAPLPFSLTPGAKAKAWDGPMAPANTPFHAIETTHCSAWRLQTLPFSAGFVDILPGNSSNGQYGAFVAAHSYRVVQSSRKQHNQADAYACQGAGRRTILTLLRDRRTGTPDDNILSGNLR